MKRLACAAVLAGLLASGAAIADPITLQFWEGEEPGSAEANVNAQQIASFEKSHPGVHVQIQNITIGAMHDKLVTSIAAGDAPDVSWGLIEWLGELHRMGALLDLTSYAADWPGRSEIYPNVLAQLTIDGKLAALPNYLGIRALIYHADILKQAGIAAPPARWDDLIAMAPRIKQATGKYAFGVAGVGVRTPQELLAILAENGVGIADKTPDGKYRNTWLTDPASFKRATEVFQLYRTLLDRGVIPPASTGWEWQQEDTNFALGQYAMVVDGAWMANYDAQDPKTMADVRLASPPKMAHAATFFEVNPIFVFKNSQHPKEAFALAAFVAGKQYQTAIFQSRSPLRDVTSDDMWGRALVSLTPIGMSYPPVALGQISKAMTDAVGRVLIAGETPQDVTRWLARAINRSLKQSGELGGA